MVFRVDLTVSEITTVLKVLLSVIVLCLKGTSGTSWMDYCQLHRLVVGGGGGGGGWEGTTETDDSII